MKAFIICTPAAKDPAILALGHTEGDAWRKAESITNLNKAELQVFRWACKEIEYEFAREPAREWWEVRYPNDPATVNSFTSREKAESFMQYFGATSNTYEIVHVREVVSE